MDKRPIRQIQNKSPEKDFSKKEKTKPKQVVRSGGEVISLFEAHSSEFDAHTFGRYDDLAMIWLEEHRPESGQDPKNWLYQLKYFSNYDTL